MAGKRSDPVAATRDAALGIQSALEGVRMEIVRLKDEVSAVEREAVSVDIAQSRLREFCERIEFDALARFDVSRFASPQYQPPSSTDVQAAATALLADLIRRDFAPRIEAAYRGGPGLTNVERAARLAKLADELLRLELAEEAMIREAERADLSILRRANADPRAVLACDEDLT